MSTQDTENMRTMVAMRDRDPVENALNAVSCLSAADRAQLCLRFNARFKNCHPPLVMDIS